MNIHKTWVVLLALLLAAMAMVPMVSAVDDKNGVDQATAQNVAEMHMQTVAKSSEMYKEWTTGTIQPSTVYYNLNDQKAAYLFNVYVDGQYSGYILTSATRDNYPVLEFSRGTVPDADAEKLSLSRQAALSSIDGKTQNIGSPKLLYLGGTFYIAQYPVTDARGNTLGTKNIDLSDNSVIDLVEMENKYPVNTDEQIARDAARVKSANQKWESLTGNAASVAVPATLAATTYGSKSIPGVPLYSQPLNNYCAPTSAGMILSYWDSHGYPNIPDNSYTLITELGTAMSTSTSTGTYIYNVDDGMNTVSSNHGYGSQLTFTEDSWVTFSDVTTEVNVNKPFVLNMIGGGTAYGRSQAYGQHTVAVIGYESYSSGDYVVIQDTWTPLTAVSLAFDDWIGAVADYSRPS
ncbi:MAG: C39 family peptidase [Methanoregula sp.]|nr:C39 family peptidase [Methanoregula sp.]